ncbi:MAG: hypothetical protein H6551_10470 [Chitinophagales bacterium]|nr:hypothetical protein [Chitinophagaceae bacterium]MCB9065552.1 hypothetical protein [Chitinophagales bacterium]
MNKKLYKIGFVGYALMFIMALLFYKERTVFVDISYHLFHILREDSFAIQNHRFGAAFTQVFPLMSGKFGLSLNTIMLIYSSCFVFYYFVCYWVAGSVLKQYKLALVILFTNILFVTDTFYWIQSELPQGLAFMMVVFAMLSSVKELNSAYLKLLLIIAGLITVVFFHPVIFIPFLFVLLFLMVHKGMSVNKWLLIFGAVFFVVVWLVKKAYFSAEYDAGAMSNASNNIKYLFPNYFTIPSNKTFLLNCLSKYYWIPITTLGVSLLYVLRRAWLKLALFLVFVGGYLMLVNISYAFSAAEDFYIENLYLPLGIMLGMPIVFDLLPSLESRSKQLAQIAFVAILLTGIGRIYVHHDLYATRLGWLRNYLDEHKEEKILMSSSKVPKDTLLMTWGTSYEFWLLSTTERGRTASIIICDDVEDKQWIVKYQQHFLAQWGVYPYVDLPKRYFKFEDSVSSYRVIK